MLEALAHTLLKLHQGTADRCDEDFRSWALNQIRPILGFDIAFWGTGVYMDGQLQLHTRGGFGLPAQIDDLWEQHKHLDETIPRILEAAGEMVVIRRAEFCRMAIYNLVWRYFGIEHGMGTSILDPSTGLCEIICFLRSDSADAINGSERILAECIVPHLIEAWRTHRVSQLCLYKQVAVPHKRALADRQGILHSAEHTFSGQLQDEWPTWDGPRLPATILGLLSVQETFRYTGKRVVVDVTPSQHADLYAIFVRPVNVIDLLTTREGEVATLFASGMSYKEIASRLALSPATVRVHLASIYQKTGITNKVALTALMASTHFA